MKFIFDNERPIYIQLLEELKIEIISERLKKGEKIPSVRELALQSKVNPNTVQKALAELEREKLIHTERTNGKYVTNDDKVIQKIKNDIIEDKVKKFISDLENIGIKENEIKNYLERKDVKWIF